MKRRIMTVLLAALMITVCLCSTSCYMNNIADDIRNSVVKINISIIKGNYRYYASGTGFAIGIPGEPVEYVVTNAHVVCDKNNDSNNRAETINIVFSDATDDKMAVRLYELYPEKDIAILKLPEPTTKLMPAILCPSDEVDMSENVALFGFPGYADLFNENITNDQNDIVKTAGVISRLTVFDNSANGIIYPVEAYLTDLKSGPGNSGGPLVNEKGQVIGIHTFGVTDTNNLLRSAYAISIDELIRTVNRDDIPFVTASEYNTRMAIIFGLGAAIAVVVIVIIILLIASLKKRNVAPADNKNETKTDVKVMVNGTSGLYAGQSFQLSSSLVFGRDSTVCQITYPAEQPGISNCHCELTLKEGEVILTDLNSSYGTFLSNGMKLTPNTPVALKNGAVFYLAAREHSFMVVIE